MRLWSLHPKYLDRQGLLALWREGLLAQKVLSGLTKGYKHHPQLDRFKSHADPVLAIAAYLHVVCDEGERRGYKFDRGRIARPRPGRIKKIPITEKELKEEFEILKGKVVKRSPSGYEYYSAQSIEPHDLFVLSGE